MELLQYHCKELQNHWNGQNGAKRHAMHEVQRDDLVGDWGLPCVQLARIIVLTWTCFMSARWWDTIHCSQVKHRRSSHDVFIARHAHYPLESPHKYHAHFPCTRLTPTRSPWLSVWKPHSSHRRKHVWDTLYISYQWWYSVCSRQYRTLQAKMPKELYNIQIHVYWICDVFMVWKRVLLESFQWLTLALVLLL